MAAVDRSSILGLVAQAEVKDIKTVEHDHKHMVQQGVLSESTADLDPHLGHEIQLAPNRYEKEPSVAGRPPNDLQEHDHVPERNDRRDARLACLFIQTPLTHYTDDRQEDQRIVQGVPHLVIEEIVKFH